MVKKNDKGKGKSDKGKGKSDKGKGKKRKTLYVQESGFSDVPDFGGGNPGGGSTWDYLSGLFSNDEESDSDDEGKTEEPYDYSKNRKDNTKNPPKGLFDFLPTSLTQEEKKEKEYKKKWEKDLENTNDDDSRELINEFWTGKIYHDMFEEFEDYDDYEEAIQKQEEEAIQKKKRKIFSFKKDKVDPKWRTVCNRPRCEKQQLPGKSLCRRHQEYQNKSHENERNKKERNKRKKYKKFGNKPRRNSRKKKKSRNNRSKRKNKYI